MKRPNPRRFQRRERLDLTPVERAIRKIASHDGENVVDAFANAARMIYKEGYGTLLLSRGELRDYDEALGHLLGLYGSDDRLSRASADAALRDAIFEAIGDHDAKPEDLDIRLSAALTALHRRLSSPASPFTCYVELAGVANEGGLPLTFGKTRIVRFTDAQLKKFPGFAPRSEEGSDKRATRLGMKRRLRQSTVWKTACAEVQVLAKDSTAAVRLAELEARRTVDTLNFFADLVPYHHGRLFLPGDSELANRTTPVLATDGAWHFVYARAGPSGPFEFKKLRSAARLRPWLAHVHRLLKKDAPTALETILLTALQWAGRGTMLRRPDEAFLSYAIALESAFLPSAESVELTYRLRTRVASLLGSSFDERRSLSRQVRDLYRTRSQIVHSGVGAVSANTLERMRVLCKTALIQLLFTREVRALRTPGELEQWFDDRAMKS